MKPELSIFRLEQTEQGAIGSLVLFEHLFCSTLEPSNDKQIPGGVYYCRRFTGQKHKNTFEVMVPGRTDLLFHPGNTSEHTEGCILLGQYPGKLSGQRAVLNSGNTFKSFMGMLMDIDWFYMQIINLY